MNNILTNEKIICLSEVSILVIEQSSIQNTLQIARDIIMQQHLFEKYNSLPLFASWPDTLIKEFLQQITIRTFVKNQIVFQEGDHKTQEIYIVESGDFVISQNQMVINQQKQHKLVEINSDNKQEVKTNYNFNDMPLYLRDQQLKQSSESQQIIIKVINSPQLFGEEDILLNNARSFTVRCQSISGELLVIEEKLFSKYILSKEQSKTFINERLNHKMQMLQHRSFQNVHIINQYNNYLNAQQCYFEKIESPEHAAQQLLGQSCSKQQNKNRKTSDQLNGLTEYTSKNQKEFSQNNNNVVSLNDCKESQSKRPQSVQVKNKKESKSRLNYSSSNFNKNQNQNEKQHQQEVVVDQPEDQQLLLENAKNSNKNGMNRELKILLRSESQKENLRQKKIAATQQIIRNKSQNIVDFSQQIYNPDISRDSFFILRRAQEVNNANIRQQCPANNSEFTTTASLNQQKQDQIQSFQQTALNSTNTLVTDKITGNVNKAILKSYHQQQQLRGLSKTANNSSRSLLASSQSGAGERKSIAIRQLLSQSLSGKDSAEKSFKNYKNGNNNNISLNSSRNKQEINNINNKNLLVITNQIIQKQTKVKLKMKNSNKQGNLQNNAQHNSNNNDNDNEGYLSKEERNMIKCVKNLDESSKGKRKNRSQSVMSAIALNKFADQEQQSCVEYDNSEVVKDKLFYNNILQYLRLNKQTFKANVKQSLIDTRKLQNQHSFFNPLKEKAPQGAIMKIKSILDKQQGGQQVDFMAQLAHQNENEKRYIYQQKDHAKSQIDVLRNSILHKIIVKIKQKDYGIQNVNEIKDNPNFKVLKEFLDRPKSKRMSFCCVLSSSEKEQNKSGEKINNLNSNNEVSVSKETTATDINNKNYQSNANNSNNKQEYINCNNSNSSSQRSSVIAYNSNTLNNNNSSSNNVAVLKQNQFSFAGNLPVPKQKSFHQQHQQQQPSDLEICKEEEVEDIKEQQQLLLANQVQESSSSDNDSFEEQMKTCRLSINNCTKQNNNFSCSAEDKEKSNLSNSYNVQSSYYKQPRLSMKRTGLNHQVQPAYFIQNSQQKFMYGQNSSNYNDKQLEKSETMHNNGNSDIQSQTQFQLWEKSLQYQEESRRHQRSYSEKNLTYANKGQITTFNKWKQARPKSCCTTKNIQQIGKQIQKRIEQDKEYEKSDLKKQKYISIQYVVQKSQDQQYQQQQNNSSIMMMMKRRSQSAQIANRKKHLLSKNSSQLKL